MGGKNKSQRTKNNVRPSSSGRSAELLGTKVSFVGFSAIKDGGYVPALPGTSEEIDATINPNFHIVLKKMNKKDATTKLKALNEFGSLCRESDPAAVKTILPFWPRLYCILATDAEHRVREAAHNAHKAVVSIVGRNIAPYLKQIAGAWFTSQYDTYPPAASAAASSFQEAFSANKLTEAIVFCQEEILDYITDNLINQTPQTLSNTKTATVEEMEAKYQRVIVSSLHGYGFYLSKLPEEQLLKMESLNKKLIENSKFWKFSKHSASIVRVAWFSAIINLCQKAPFFLPDFKKQISSAVFNGLDDTDSVVLPVVWEAALHLIDKIKDCWEYVSAEKLVLPKLWKILREGGSGCAASIFPNMLPFLSIIPDKIITDKLAFYSRFFSSLQDGIKQRNVQLSVIESEAVAECYVECFSYTIISSIEDTEFCNHLISQQVLHVIELTLKDEKLQSFRKPFYNKLIGMLVLWSKQQKCDVLFSKLVRDVFNRSISICCDLIDRSSFDKKQMCAILSSQYDLISAFKYQTCKLKKRLKVTFSEDKSPDAEEQKRFENFFEKTPASFQFETNDFVKKIIEKYFNCISAIETCKSFFVGQIAKVVTIFDSSAMFAHLLMLGGSANTWNELYTKYISVWLNDKDISVEDVSQLVFILLKYVEDEDEKQSVLHSLSETESKKVLEWCLKNDNFKFSSVKHWLLSEKVDSIILSVVKDAISLNDTDSDKSYRIIKSCLKKTNDACILIKIETVISVLKCLKENLKSYQNCKGVINLDNVAGLVDACLTVFKDYHDEKYEEDVIDIISECFKLCLFESTSSALDRTWQDNLVHFILNGDFIRKLTVRCSRAAADFITDRLNLTVDDLHQTVRQCAKYLASLDSESFNEIDDFVELFLKEMLFVNERRDRIDSLLKFCYCVEVINGKLSLPVINDMTDEILNCDFKEIFSEHFMYRITTRSLFAVLFLLQITGLNDCLYFLRNVGVNKTVHRSEDHGGCGSADFNLKNVKLNNYTCYLADSVLKVAAFRVFKENFSKTKQFFECDDYVNIFERCTKELIQKLSDDSRKDIERELIQRGCDSVIGGLCARAIYILHFDFLDTDNLKSTLETIANENQLIFSRCDLLSHWIHQVFAVGTGFTNTDSIYKLLFTHLPKQNFMDSDVKSVIDDWSSRIFKLGNLQTFEMDLLSSDLKEVQTSADIADLLCVMIDSCPSSIDEQSGWDFTMIAAASWICNIKKVVSSDRHCFTLPILHLLKSVIHLFKSISNHTVSLEDGSRLKTEWNDVFRSDIHKTLVEVWADISDNQAEETMRPALYIIFHELSITIDEIVDANIFITKSNLSFWLEIACSRLECSALDIQFAAFKLLIKLTPHLVASDSECNEGNKDVNVSFKCTEKWLKRTQTIVDTMLSGFKLGDTCIVEPFTDGYVYTRCYFFLWLFILEICDTADSQLRFMYTGWIKENRLLEYLIKSLFCVMPEEIVHGHEGNIKYLELFSDPPQFSSGLWNSKTLAHLSCWTYYKLLKRLPAEVRQWWSEIDHKEATIIERLTASFVSPLLCANEMKAVRLKAKNIQNMTVRVHPAAREVVAIYIVEESSMELVIQLPLNHPLGPTKVESGKCMVSTNQTRQWIMQLSLFLTHQNGSIWDALSLWKTMIEKKFEGVEECYICFSILHNTTQQLPRLTCQTCKKKFHNSCLYQWFTTSNKSTCPICRNLF